MPFLRSSLLGCAVLCAASSPSAQPQPDGPNCAYSEKPVAAAGEQYVQIGKETMFFRVFPRVSDIEPDYTGCQILWTAQTPDLSKITASLVYFEKGKAKSVWPNPPDPMCKRDELTEATGCLLPASLIAVSFPAGCITRSIQEGKMPADCTESFKREYSFKEQVHVQRAKRENAP